LWLLSPEALAPWRLAARLLREGHSPAEALPELASDYAADAGVRK